MPIHDWTKADPVVFHNLQLGWAAELSRRLNHGILPSDRFAVMK